MLEAAEISCETHAVLPLFLAIPLAARRNLGLAAWHGRYLIWQFPVRGDRKRPPSIIVVLSPRVWYVQLVKREDKVKIDVNVSNYWSSWNPWIDVYT